MQANFAPVRIPRMPEYIDPQGESPESIHPHPPSDYEIPEPVLSKEVQIKGSLWGKNDKLTYCDHDLTDSKKFRRFQPDKYLLSQQKGAF